MTCKYINCESHGPSRYVVAPESNIDFGEQMRGRQYFADHVVWRLWGKHRQGCFSAPISQRVLEVETLKGQCS